MYSQFAQTFILLSTFQVHIFWADRSCRSIDRKIKFDLFKRNPYFLKEIILSRSFLFDRKKNYNFLELKLTCLFTYKRMYSKGASIKYTPVFFIWEAVKIEGIVMTER